MPKALITGITGQDAAYLVRLLLQKDYEIYGMCPRRSSQNESMWRLAALGIPDNKINFIYGDVTDAHSCSSVIEQVQPDEVYNLAAQSFVKASFSNPNQSFQVNAVGVVNMLTAIMLYSPQSRFYQASTSEMFGLVNVESQDESTPFHPRSPYGIAKAAGHYFVQNYREAYGLHASSGILFNHESPLRGIEFVTKKITDGIANIKAGNVNKLPLGNLDAKRDWGHAEDYVYAMWLMLQQDAPDDYVIATGKAHSVDDFARIAFSKVGLNYKEHIKSDKRFMRPSDVPILCGNPKKAHDVLGWKPRRTFDDLIDEMIRFDLGRYGINEIKTEAS